MKLFILAGEPSGDRLGADLLRRLRHRVEVHAVGVGGPELAGEGLQSLFPMSDLSVMGVSDVLKRLPLLLWRIAETARIVLREQPEVVVLIDAQEFSLRVAQGLRRRGWKRPILLYVSPSVWARAPERAGKLNGVFNEVLAVLPFEPAAMRRLGGPPTSYVGHPAVADAGEAVPTGDRIALLPGSRDGELRRHLPLLRDLAARLAGRFGIDSFFVPTLPGREAAIRREFEDWTVEVEVTANRQRRRELYGETMLAICVSGTATLELALAGVPSVITYVLDRTQRRHYAALGRPRIGLPNIILDRDLVPEVVLNAPEIEALAEPVEQLIAHREAREAQRRGFRQLRSLMEKGGPGDPVQDPAERVLSHLPQLLRPARGS